MQMYPLFLPGSPIRGYHSISHAREQDVYPGLQRTHSLGSSSNESKRRISSCSSPPPITSLDGDQFSVEYLASLMKEQKQLSMFPKMFTHIERLLDNEIVRVREALFQNEFSGNLDIDLPEPNGPIVTITEKLYVPVREFPDYNFVGRILGPRGMTAKQLEQETGCRIMVRGKGSMKDKRREESHRGRPNWEHLEDDLHVLIQCEDTENRCRVKLASAMQHVSRLLVPAPDGTDELKRKQLMELAIINGTYRPYHRQATTPKSPSSPMLPLLNTPPTFTSLF